MVSIIIITRHQEKILRNSLPIIFNQDFKNFEVIIVDSSSDRKTEILGKEYKVKVIKYRGETGKLFNYAKAFNLGGKASRGDIIVRLSGDAIPVNNSWLSNLLKPLANAEVAGTYSQQIYSGSADWHYKLLHFFAFSRFRPFFEKAAFGLMFWGTACALRKKLWEKIPFDERQRTMEDARWSFEVSKLGFKTVYVPSSVVWHSHRRKLKDTLYENFFNGGITRTFSLYFEALLWNTKKRF